MKDYTVILTLRKSTKGTHVYENEAAGFPSVYIPKNKPCFVNGAPPDKLAVTFHEADSTAIAAAKG